MEYINRTNIKVDENTHRIYSMPVNYKKDDGSYEPVDFTFKDSSSTIGDISLNRKNCFSTGIRKDKNPEKYVGIRPDDCQDGSKQIEISINDVEINKVSGYDIDKFISAPSSSSLFQMYSNTGFKDFKIEFKLHLKGITIENNKFTETTKIRNKLDTEFINLGQDTGTNILNRYANDPSITSNESYLRVYYGQITDEFFARFSYDSKDEFGDADISNYSFYDMVGTGSSTYLKDSLVFYAVGKDINDFSDSVLINICNKYGLSLEGNLEDTGKYFFKNGKKVGGYVPYENKLLAYLNTKDIPSSIKDLYINKAFNETSYLDLSINQFDVDMKNQFNYDVEAIEVDTSYYQGTQYVLNSGNGYFGIDLPKIFDTNFYEISSLGDCTHTLKDNGDGTYLYTKYLSIEGLLRNLGNEENYIDVNIYQNYHTGGTGIASKQTYYSMRNATTSPNFVASSSNITVFAEKFRTSNTSGATYRHKFHQSHYNFDTSSISSASAANLKMYGKFVGSLSGAGASYGAYDGIQTMVLKSTVTNDGDGNGTPNQVSDMLASWNDFTGFTSGWDSDDVTEYIDSSINLPSSSTSQAWITKALNSTALSDIESGSIFKIAMIEDDEYYSGTFESAFRYSSVSNANGVARKYLDTPNLISSWYNNTLDSTYYTYLEVTTGTTAATENATFFGANF